MVCHADGWLRSKVLPGRLPRASPPRERKSRSEKSSSTSTIRKIKHHAHDQRRRFRPGYQRRSHATCCPISGVGAILHRLAAPSRDAQPIKAAATPYSPLWPCGRRPCRNLWLTIFYIFTTLLSSRNQKLDVEVFMKITGNNWCGIVLKEAGTTILEHSVYEYAGIIPGNSIVGMPGCP